MSAAPMVSVIVLCYNGIRDTLACLESLRRQDQPADSILVVDNASQDGTPDVVEHAFPEVKVIRTGRNLGYAAGNNLGIDAALASGARAVFLLNNDTSLEAGCLSALTACEDAQPQAGAIGPMVYTYGENPVISSAGGQIVWRNADAVNVGAGEVDSGRYPRRMVDFVNGCGLLVTRQAVEKAGLLDSQYFMYWEETDWCARIRACGLEVWFEPAARMRHKATLKSSDLSATTLYYMTRNRFRYFSRHTPLRFRPIVLLRALKGTLSGIRNHERAGRTAHATATRYALFHAMIGMYGQADTQPWSK